MRRESNWMDEENCEFISFRKHTCVAQIKREGLFQGRRPLRISLPDPISHLAAGFLNIIGSAQSSSLFQRHTLPDILMLFTTVRLRKSCCWSFWKAEVLRTLAGGEWSLLFNSPMLRFQSARLWFWRPNKRTHSHV